MNKKDTILSALDLAFKKSAEFQKGERYDQMKEVYLGLREDIMYLDVDTLDDEMFKMASSTKDYMQLFWNVTDTALANKVYNIKIKALGYGQALTYGEKDLLPTVMYLLNSYLESLTDGEIIDNEEGLNNLRYLTERVYGMLHNEKRDSDSL